jgi:hypothetical protein
MRDPNKPRRFLALPFVARFDAWLLRNYPDIWSTRIHLVFYYGLILYLGVFLVYFFIPDDIRSRPTVEYWVISAVLFALVGVVFWLVYLLRFNVLKRYGRLTFGDRLRNFLLFYICFLAIIGVVYVPFIVEKVKSEAFFTDNEIIRDVNDMNLYLCLLEKDSINITITTDTLILVNDMQEAIRRNAELAYGMGDGSDPRHLEYTDTIDGRMRLSYADSVVPLGNKAYIIRDYTNLDFVQPGAARYEGTAYTLRSPDLYRMAWLEPPAISNAEARKRLAELQKKYVPESEDENDFWNYYSPADDNLQAYLFLKYELRPMQSSLENISNRKHRFRRHDLRDSLLVCLYFALGMNLLLFAFRHSTVRTFFFSLLAGVILAVLTGLMVAIFRLRDEGIITLYFIYYAAFLVLSLTIFRSRKRSLIKGIALNFLFWMTFTLPGMIVMAWYEFVSRPRFDYVYYDENYYQNMRLNYELSQYAGAALLLVGVTFFFSKMYRTWYSQPEE